MCFKSVYHTHPDEYPIKFRFVDTLVVANTSDFTPAQWLRVHPVRRYGMDGYFNGFTGHRLPFAPGTLPWNPWSYRFDTILIISKPGTYTLYTNSQDGSTLWLDGTKVVDNAGVHLLRKVGSGGLSLNAGSHLLQVLFIVFNAGLLLVLPQVAVPMPMQDGCVFWFNKEVWR